MSSIGKKIFASGQHLLPKHALSRWMHALTRVRNPSLRRLAIDRFLRHYDVDMQEAVESDPHAYADFNAFFTRALKPGARPIDLDANAVVSPVDGTVSQCGMIDDDLILQAKGHHYSLLALLGGNTELVQRYRGGAFACIYLAPYNYHRIHMPLTGTLSNTTYVPGCLFSVNAATASYIPNLWARNERVICNFHASQTDFAMAFIGALFVGSIETVWAGEINPMPRKQRRIVNIEQGRGITLHKGAEAGRFNMGSTVIMLVERDRMQWDPNLQAGVNVRLGQRIGTLHSA